MLKRRLHLHALTLLVGTPILAAIPGGSMILAILGISFLIFIHEWGHFTACRLTGTRTETFSIGFGPRLFGWEKDRTGVRRFTVGRRQLDPADHAMDFRIAAVPLGGYVKMAGEIPGEGGAATGEPPAPDEFPAKSALARTFIISAGVIMNFITAVVFYTIAIQGGKAHRAPVVGVVQAGAGAWHAGVEAGDRIVSIGDRKTPTWIDVQMEIAFAPSQEATPVIVRRNGAEKRLDVTPVYNEERGILAFGIASVHGLKIGEGDDAFAIGIAEPVTVEGVPAVGGAAAFALVKDALAAGRYPVHLAKPDGQSIVLEAQASAEGEPTAEAPSPKVGLMPYAPAHVTAVRGEAAKIFVEGDILRAANVGTQRIDLHSEALVHSLRFEPTIASFEIERDAKTLTQQVGLESPAAIAGFLDDLALESKVEMRVVPLTPGALYLHGDLYRYPSIPAAEAGIPPGALIKRVGTVIVRSWSEILDALKATEPGQAIELAYAMPAGPERTVSVTPVALTRLGAFPVTIVQQREHWHADGIADAAGMGAARTWRETKNVFRTIGALFTGNISFHKNIAGPITLIKVSKSLAEDSFLRLLWFLAYVSVMLAVLNILPIPVLDGGHLVFILIEKIKGKPLSDEMIFRFQKVGFLLLLVLMCFAFYNDIARLFNS